MNKPSYEAPPSGSSSQDGDRLSPETSLLHQRANQDSGINDWLKAHGIPFYDARAKVSDRASAVTTLTAGNVDQRHLVNNLAWAFFEALDIDVVVPKYALRNVFNSVGMYTARAHAQPQAPLMVPQDWTDQQDSDTTSITLACLGLHFQAMHTDAKMSHEPTRFTICPRKVVESLEYPEAKVTLNEARRFPEDPARCVEWTMLKIFGFPGVSKCRSEMDVERDVGSILAGFFNIQGCVTSAGNQIKYPTAVGCFGSFPKPDLGTRVSDASESLPELFRPLVLIGEAKRSVMGKDRAMESKDAHSNRISAQLAWAVQPTLVAVIADTMLKWESRRADTKGPFVIPHHAIVYGIAYDAFGFIIYGFFPRVLHHKPDGTPDQWGFGCAPLDLQFNKVFSRHSREQRLRACVCLLMIQHHATMLSAKLRNIELPDEFKACARLWAQRKL